MEGMPSSEAIGQEGAWCTKNWQEGQGDSPSRSRVGGHGCVSTTPGVPPSLINCIDFISGGMETDQNILSREETCSI